jgi:hypothetical protein
MKELNYNEKVLDRMCDMCQKHKIPEDVMDLVTYSCFFEEDTEKLNDYYSLLVFFIEDEYKQKIHNFAVDYMKTYHNVESTSRLS